MKVLDLDVIKLTLIPMQCYTVYAKAQIKMWDDFMSLKRLSVLLLAILMLSACAFAEEYVPADVAAEWRAEDFNGAWHIFYRIDDGVGSSTRESDFQIDLVIDGESVIYTFSYPDGESVTNWTIEYAEPVTLSYEDGQTMDVELLEDGTLQLHVDATGDTMETSMFFERVEP